MKKENYSSRISYSNISINDDFWSSYQELMQKSVLPYQYDALNDNIPNAEKSYAVENFNKAIALLKARANGEATPTYPTDQWHYGESETPKDAFHGWVFQDSDIYKWIEATSYSLRNAPNKDLQEKLESIVELVCKAQMPNGYLNTLYTINNPENAFTNLRDFHELYCFGHLAEASVAHFEATGNKTLLDACCRYADLICDTFGKGKKEGYDGHEIAEMALMKLYRITGKKEYLDTAKFFIDVRGTRPYFFDIEHNCHSENEAYHYNQAHKPPRYQKEAVGHAVRGVYLYSGMADVAKHSNDDELYQACVDIWNNITKKKMYITGGIGSTVHGEAFTFDYDLPNDTAYCETCASIGLVFFGIRMLEINPSREIADTIERALYNTILSGMNNEGNAFFYVNPLEVLPEACHKDERKHHVKPVRQKWFGCACCPPNLARLICSIGEYCFTQSSSTLFIHQYIGSQTATENFELDIKSSYTVDGKVQINVKNSTLPHIALRIPSWCKNYSFDKPCTIKDGYAYFDISEKNFSINADFELAPKIVKCSNRVRENIGKVALTYGPFVYCIEEVDNGKDLQMLLLDANTDFKAQKDRIIAKGFKEQPDNEDTLYFENSEPFLNEQDITFIPYYHWGNRGENEMSVYVRIKK